MYRCDPEFSQRLGFCSPARGLRVLFSVLFLFLLFSYGSPPPHPRRVQPTEPPTHIHARIYIYYSVILRIFVIFPCPDYVPNPWAGHVVRVARATHTRGLHYARVTNDTDTRVFIRNRVMVRAIKILCEYPCTLGHPCIGILIGCFIVLQVQIVLLNST